MNGEIESRLKLVESLGNQLDQLSDLVQLNVESHVQLRVNLLMLTLACNDEDEFQEVSNLFLDALTHVFVVPDKQSSKAEEEQTTKKKKKPSMKTIHINGLD